MATTTRIKPIVYPDSDGKPVGENTVHFRWIATLVGGVRAVFMHRPDVFVAGDLFWYPVEGRPKIVQAPDVLVAFGRPAGDRDSYRQWDEGNVAPQVIVEVYSPSDRARQRAKKFQFYQTYGVEEYYTYDPVAHAFTAWRRDGDHLVAIPDPNGFVSPRLGVRFETVTGTPLRVIRPDGAAFLTYDELYADYETQLSRLEAQMAKAAAGQSREDALKAKLRELGVDPDTI